MATEKDRRPIDVLFDMELLSKRNAFALPEQIEVKSTWDGIGFRIGDYQLVTPMEQVSEILDYPVLTVVPGTKNWVKGVANIRGNLLPILDLKGFVTGSLTDIKRQSRVLVVHHHGISVGLLVDESLGLQHFLDEEHSKGAPNLDPTINRFLSGAYHQGNKQWWVIDFYQLVESTEFMHVAA